MNTLARTMTCIGFLGLFGIAGQGPLERNDPYSVGQVHQLLKTPVGFSSGFDEKASERLGDRMAIALLKIYPPEELKNPKVVRRCLGLISQAFQAPSRIDSSYDRQPDVALVLLAYFESNVADPELRREISKLKHSLAGMRPAGSEVGLGEKP